MTTGEVYRDRQGRWRWRLLAANHEIVADSGQSYGRERDCLDGLKIATEGPPTIITIKGET